jgi:hypothetical protein
VEPFAQPQTLRIAPILNNKVATQYEHAFGKIPSKFSAHLQMWGEAIAVKTKVMGASKMAEGPWSYICLFIGYAQDHEGNCYCMWILLTNGEHLSSNIIWLCTMNNVLQYKDIGSNNVAETKVLDDAHATPDCALPAAPAVPPGLVPERDDDNYVSVHNETPCSNDNTSDLEAANALGAPATCTLSGHDHLCSTTTAHF